MVLAGELDHRDKLLTAPSARGRRDADLRLPPRSERLTLDL
jgi:hypothetical protein